MRNPATEPAGQAGRKMFAPTAFTNRCSSANCSCVQRSSEETLPATPIGRAKFWFRTSPPAGTVRASPPGGPGSLLTAKVVTYWNGCELARDAGLPSSSRNSDPKYDTPAGAGSAVAALLDSVAAAAAPPPSTAASLTNCPVASDETLTSMISWNNPPGSTRAGSAVKGRPSAISHRTSTRGPTDASSHASSAISAKPKDPPPTPGTANSRPSTSRPGGRTSTIVIGDRSVEPPPTLVADTW